MSDETAIRQDHFLRQRFNSTPGACCGWCVYWEMLVIPSPHAPSDCQDEGECHRRAPAAVPSPDLNSLLRDDALGGDGQYAAWPRTFAETGWCGEFEEVAIHVGAVR